MAYTKKFLNNLKVGNEFEGGIVQCIMSGYFYYNLMPLIYVEVFCEHLNKVYEEKYGNWLDETFVMLETRMEKIEEPEKSPIMNKIVAIALSDFLGTKPVLSVDVIPEQEIDRS